MTEMVMTQTGLARLSEELERLKTEGRRSIAARLQHAASCEANRGENADYLDAREEQALLEKRISTLEERIRSAEIVEPDLGNGRIDVGERVLVHDLDADERLELELVGPVEADPRVGRISIASPVGRAILGLRRGDLAEVEAPRGKLRFKVLAVELPTPAALG
jgi:transcription elongation factor GreA